MPDNSVVNSIALRFNSEVYDIQRYRNFLQLKQTVDIFDIEHLNSILEANSLPCLPEREFLGLPPYHLSQSELVDVAKSVHSIDPAVHELIDQLAKEMDALNVHANDSALEVNEFNDLVAYFLESIPEGTQVKETWVVSQALRESAEQPRDSIDPEDEIYGDSIDTLNEGEKQHVFETAFRHALYRRLSDRSSSLQDVLDRFDEIQFIASTEETTAVAGTYHLGFIALMAAFDAAVFDLVRAGLQSNFFQHAKAFGSEKYRLEEIVAMGSWEAIRDEIIERETKKRYLKQILRILNDDWSVDCMPPNRQLVDLIEIVNRRNVHVHNRGVADKAYCEAENPYGLQVGEVAVIDMVYWQNAKELCQYCIKQIAGWAKSTG